MNASSSTALPEFLHSKFDHAIGHISVWTKQNKQTVAFPSGDLNRAVEYILASSRTFDTYVAISTQVTPPSGNGRGGVNTVAALTGVFADIDFADAKGAHTGYPKNQEEALEILSAFPIKPTSIINTGNGVQLHFDFVTPWAFANDADRAVARELSAKFQRSIAQHYRASGRKIDSVGDIVRNFRPPGTLNHKNVPPKPVVLLRSDPSNRISVQELQDFMAAPASSNSRPKSAPSKALGVHARIVAECRWYRTVVVEGAASCSEPDWFAGASIAALCVNGEAEFLDFSGRHPGFTLREATDKFRRAVKSNKPRTCESIAGDLGHEKICQGCKHFGHISSPVQLGREGYDPGQVGPIPLGYSAEGSYVFLDPGRQLLITASSSQLLTLQYLVGLAPVQFWASQFPAQKEGSHVNPWAAGQALMDGCRSRGPFDPRKVRGRGVWLEGDRIVLNFGAALPKDLRHTYLCFEPLPLRAVSKFETDRLKRFLERFVWRNPQDAVLLLGWLALAPICGVLSWRPHCFVYGPPNCGKSTIHGTAGQLLQPLGLSADGQSSEAGIRQMLKADSRPVILDEFESDHGRNNVSAVIRLARSASSAESPVLRGTPEGKAMQFALRTTFFFAAINPSGMSPADATRILMFEMLAHTNDPETAKRIAEDDAFFLQKGPEWCGYMSGLAHLLPRAIVTFSKAMPGIDSRHRKNVATLLAGAFVATEGRAPTDVEAETMAMVYKGSIDLHAEEFERDDAQECLQHLFAFPVEKYTLGFWLAAALAEKSGDLPEVRWLSDGARRISRNFEIVVRDDGEAGFFIRNGSPPVETVFRDTKWSRGAWEKALRKTTGYFAPSSPIHFANAKSKSRAIGLPLDVLPDIDFSEFQSEGREFGNDGRPPY